MISRFHDAWSRHPVKISILVSILVHLIFLLTFGEWSKVLAWVPEPSMTDTEEPLVFDLTENPNAREDDAPDERTNLLSDRNGRARSNAQTNLPEGTVPYSESPVDNALQQARPQSMMNNQPPVPQNAENPQEESEAEADEEHKNNEAEESVKENRAETEIPVIRKKFSRDVLTRERNAMQADPFAGALSYNNREADAKEIGDFSLNTYNWDFAPYLLELKRRIQRNIFPPPAFSIMGIIEGEYVVRFTILPNGTLQKVEVLDSQGHESLERTSVKAIELSAPFLPLPDHFPEDRLVITGRFMYHILDEYGRPMRR